MRGVPFLALAAAAIAACACTPAPLAAQDVQPRTGHGVLVRVGGDIDVASWEEIDLVVVAGGEATIAGTVHALLVVDGTAVLDGATVGDVMIVRSTVRLRDGARVTNDVNVWSGDVDADDRSVVGGEIVRGSRHVGVAFGFVAALVGFGFMVAILLAGLAAAAVVPRGLRRAGRTLTGELPRTLLAAALLWIAFPIASLALLPTIVGIPIGIGTFVFVLPVLGFLGYLVTSVRVGDYVLARTRHDVEAGRPFLAVGTGLGILLVLGIIPLVRNVVTPVAGMLGAGALVLTAWRAARAPVERPAPQPEPEPVSVA